MRQFSSPGFRIWNLAREAKLVYTCFGVCSLLALASTMALYEDMVGPKTPGIAAYYYEGRDGQGAGTPPRTPPPSDTPPGSTEKPRAAGPEIALPDDLPQAPVAGSITVAVSYRKLLEVTHFHLFTVPVFLLIITHLFMLTGLRSSTKMAWIAGGWLASMGHMAAPWVVHYRGGAAWVYATSGAALAVTSVVLTAYPIWVMWSRPAAAATSSRRDTA